MVVSRLSLYLRELQHLVRDGRATVSSSQLGKLLGFTDAQVRKDLAYFGHFGHPGIGYRCDELIAEIRRILGTDRQWIVTMVGVGNMGRALLRYKGFAAQGFRIVAAFDRDPRIVGTKIEGIPVYDFAAAWRNRPAAADSAGHDHRAGDRKPSRWPINWWRPEFAGIVNFAPVTLSLPEGDRLGGRRPDDGARATGVLRCQSHCVRARVAGSY